MFASEILRFNRPKFDSRRDFLERDKINLHFKFDNKLFEICGQSLNLRIVKIDASPSEQKGSTSASE